MLRAVLGIALAAALLGVVTPALDDARTTRTERLTGRELGRVESAAQTLVREQAPGARRTLRLSFPEKSPTAAPLTFVAFGGIPPDEIPEERRPEMSDTADGDILVYSVAGGSPQIRHIDTDLRVVRDATRVESDSRAVVLHRGGTYHLTLELARVRGQSIVVVSVGDRAVRKPNLQPPATATHFPNRPCENRRGRTAVAFAPAQSHRLHPPSTNCRA